MGKDVQAVLDKFKDILKLKKFYTKEEQKTIIDFCNDLYWFGYQDGELNQLAQMQKQIEKLKKARTH